MKVLVVNGPNLNMLGKREEEIYGNFTLKDIEDLCKKEADNLGIAVDLFQSNQEGELVEAIQKADKNFDGIIINAAAFTHTSVAIHDALKLLSIPIIEVHISNIFAREAFRHHSYISSLAKGVICGLGIKGYVLALEYLAGK